MVCHFFINSCLMKEFDIILEAVADVMGLLPCEVLNKRKFPEIVEARVLVIRLLAERGYFPHQIASWMSMTPRNVNLILSALNLRLDEDLILRRNLEEARKQVRKSFS